MAHRLLERPEPCWILTLTLPVHARNLLLKLFNGLACTFLRTPVAPQAQTSVALADPPALRPLTSLRWPYIPEEPSYPDPLAKEEAKPLQLPQYESIGQSPLALFSLCSFRADTHPYSNLRQDPPTARHEPEAEGDPALHRRAAGRSEDVGAGEGPRGGGGPEWAGHGGRGRGRCAILAVARGGCRGGCEGRAGRRTRLGGGRVTDR